MLDRSISSSPCWNSLTVSRPAAPTAEFGDEIEVEAVGTRAAVQQVGPPPAGERVIATTAGERIVAVDAALEEIGAAVASQIIVVKRAEKVLDAVIAVAGGFAGIVTGSQQVGDDASEIGVVRVVRRIAPEPAPQHIGAAVAGENVVALEPVERVGGIVADEDSCSAHCLGDRTWSRPNDCVLDIRPQDIGGDGRPVLKHEPYRSRRPPLRPPRRIAARRRCWSCRAR